MCDKRRGAKGGRLPFYFINLRLYLVIARYTIDFYCFRITLWIRFEDLGFSVQFPFCFTHTVQLLQFQKIRCVHHDSWSIFGQLFRFLLHLHKTESICHKMVQQYQIASYGTNLTKFSATASIVFLYMITSSIGRFSHSKLHRSGKKNYNLQRICVQCIVHACVLGEQNIYRQKILYIKQRFGSGISTNIRDTLAKKVLAIQFDYIVPPSTLTQSPCLRTKGEEDKQQQRSNLQHFTYIG